MSQGKDLIVNAVLEEEQRKTSLRRRSGKILEHYGCVLSPEVVISRKGTRIRVDIIAKSPAAPDPKG